MAGHESNLTNFIPNWVNSAETQSLLMTAALIMIAWLVLSWIIQTVITLLWPLSVGLLLIVLFLPDTAQWLFHDVLPPYVAAFKVWATTMYVQANNSLHSLNENRNTAHGGCM